MTNTPQPARRFLSGQFILAAVILLACAVGLRPAIAGLIAAYSKEPIELRKKLDKLDLDKLPSWRRADEHRVQLHLAAGDVETEDVVSIVLEPESESLSQQEQAMLFITYYSDPRDRISHTPEVCYRQSGAVIQSLSTITIDTPELGPEYPQIEARLLDIDLIARRTVLAYVFVCNGKILCDREKVRFQIGWPGDSHIYFSKIEAISPCPTDDDYEAAVARVTGLLREALPVLINEHFPRNEDVR